MKIVIIEDELLTAEDLKNTILDIEPDARVIAILSSIKEAVFYFQKNERPDLIFSDIQLGDGLSFEIFKEIPITTPVIFCTAYDEYALQAFKANGIDYILKPFDEKAVRTALGKFVKLKDPGPDLQKQIRQAPHSSLLVYQRDKIFPIRLCDVALIYVENEITHLLTFEKKIFTI